MNTDPIADLLTRIRNASRKQHTNVLIPYSAIKEQILKVMKKSDFIVGFKVEKGEKFKQLNVELKNNPNISLKRVSSPGQRVYVANKDIKKVVNGIGVSIISTPKGVISGYEAKKLGVGGEILCEIY
jgi:small subunit ribosomal protein S8